MIYIKHIHKIEKRSVRLKDEQRESFFLEIIILLLLPSTFTVFL